MTYGKGVHLEQETSISRLLDIPDQYLGRKVKTSGIAVPFFFLWFYG